MAVVGKWGNSPAVRIPVSVIRSANLEIYQQVQISVEGNRIIIEPTLTKTYKLDDLVSEINADNLHAEIETSGPVGREIW